METRLEKLKEKISQIDTLRNEKRWGPKYQVWVNLTEKLLNEYFGKEALNLFKKQQSVVIDEGAYLRELNGRKEILNELLANNSEYKPEIESSKFINYWKPLFSSFLKFIIKYLIEVIVGVIIIAVSVWLKLSH
jgi:hypothetical protein